MDNKKSVFIIDGSSFLYRAYYSIKPLQAPDGSPVNALYGFCRMIRRLIDTYDPQCMVLVWDSRGKTVRHEIYSEYKSSRQAPPLDLANQKNKIQEFAELIGIAQIQTPGIEADDLMYSLTRELMAEGTSSILVTSDKDMGQALNDFVTILDPFKEQFVTKADLELKMGFPVEKLPFYYALLGDSSDNIPGVRGIGAKGALELVSRYASLEDLYKQLDSVPEKARKLLEASRDNAFLSEKLFILQKYELHMTRENCAFAKENWQKAYPFFEQMAFKSLLKEQEKKENSETKSTLHLTYNFITITTKELLDEVCALIKQAGHCALDTEGTSLRPLEGSMVGLSLSVMEGTAYYIPFGHMTGDVQLERSVVIDTLKPILEDESIAKYLHHAKFDALMLHHAGIELKGIVFDTMLAASLVVEDGQRVGLKYLSDYYLKEPMQHFAQVLKEHKCVDFSLVPIAEATKYAAADAHQTLRLTSLFRSELEKKGLRELFEKLEMPLVSILYEMEKTGIRLDPHVLQTINEKVSQELNTLKSQISDLIGIEHSCINLNSPKQLEELLFVTLQLPRVKKTEQKTAYSTDQEVLRQLAKLHPVPGFIMRYRELYKLKSTYLDALGEYINPLSGKVHTTFNQTNVATGRLASSDPNLQNIPVEGFHIRSAFKADEGQFFLSADYSQIELRVLAYLSQDSALLTAFNEQQDIHALTASGLFGVSLDEVTYEQRQIGKRVNFSILYGLTPHGLSKELHISHSLASDYIAKFMSAYSGVAAWMDAIVEQTKEQGYVATLWGRRRYVPGIYEKNKTLYNLARRIVMNTPVQGTAAELMKWGMIALNNELKKAHLNGKMLLQIHDEIVMQVPFNEAEETQALVRATLQNVVSWNVPLQVSVRTGQDWQQITK